MSNYKDLKKNHERTKKKKRKIVCDLDQKTQYC